MDLLIAGGFPNRFRSIRDEIAASKIGRWFPNTVDFRATAGHSGNFKGAPATFDALLDLISKQPKESIRELGLIGHANPQAFALAGMFMPSVNDLVFTGAGMIHPVSIKEKWNKLVTLRDRFAHKGYIDWPTITLYACDAGTGAELLQALATALEVQVRGFKNEIVWCLTSSGVRGKTFYDNVGMGLHPDCSRFSPDIRVWKPDSETKLIEITESEEAAWDLRFPSTQRSHR
jgi:hypothetical protein